MTETSGNQSVDFVEAPAASARPRLIYDGDCGFCGYWARYWRKLTGDSVEYRPYQQVLAQYPTISEAEFQRAVQFIAPDGRRASGAEASFLTLAHARGKGFWLALYRYLPGFAPVSELAYAFIAKRRPAFYRVEPHAVGKGPRAAALRARLVPVPSPVRAHHPFRLRLLRRAGARTDRQPRHSAALRTGRRAGRPSRTGAFRSHADGVLAERQRSRRSDDVLGWRRLVAHAGFQSPAAAQSCSDLRALSLAALCRPDLHELPVGHVPAGDDCRRAHHERQADHRRLARALALVSLHVHVGRRQADQRRSQLEESLGARLPFSDAAAADAARVVRGAGCRRAY